MFIDTKQAVSLQISNLQVSNITIRMSLFKPSPNALQEYIRLLGITDGMPTRCDLFFKPRLIAFFAPTKDGLQCLKRLIALANAYQNIVFRLKIIVCLHHIVMSSNHFNEQIIDLAIQRLECNPSVQNGDVVKWISGLARIYYNYIRKLCTNTEIYWLAKNGKPFSKHEPISAVITRIYMFMNLIKSAFPVKQLILNFGRYFKAEYPLIIDVNKCIVSDMGLLYTALAEMIDYLVKNYKTKLTKEEVKQLATIVDQTFLIHEELYVLFYNRYYAYDIDAPKVNWLKLEPSEYQQLKNEAREKKKKKRVDSSKASIDSFDLSQFQNTYFSQTTATKEFEFQNIQI